MINVTWLLTNVTIPGKGSIDYLYNNSVSINTTVITEPILKITRICSQLAEDSPLPRLSVGVTLPQQNPAYQMRFIKSIHFGPTRVDFMYNDQGRHMEKIVVIDNNDTVRTFSLGISGSYLSSLDISGQNNDGMLKYGFEYYPNNYLNSWSSNLCTDFWGNLCESNTRHDIGNFNLFINNREYGNIRIDTATIQQQIHDLARFVPNKEYDASYYYKIKLQSTVSGESRQPTPPECHGVLRAYTFHFRKQPFPYSNCRGW